MEKAYSERYWTDFYYEMLEFFYWEPQHLGRQKQAIPHFASVKEVMKHLQRMEVTRNQQLVQFFSIAPRSLRRDLFERVFDAPFVGDFVMHGRELDAIFKLNNAMQPDFLFTGTECTVSIEMKLGSNTDLNQVLKYALLALAVEEREGRKDHHYLLFLGPSEEFADLWARKAYESPAQVSAKLSDRAQSRDPDFFAKYSKRFENADRFWEIVKSLKIGFLSYAAFKRFIQEQAPIDDSTPGSEVYRNLIDGMCHELSRVVEE